MGVVRKLQRSPFMFVSRGMKCLIALFVACTLAITVMLVGAAASSGSAYAVIKPTSESAQAASVQAAETGEEEAIEDDENPMSSGLDSAELASQGGVPIYAITAVGIVAVAAFFWVSTRKQNDSISKMHESFR